MAPHSEVTVRSEEALSTPDFLVCFDGGGVNGALV